MKTNCRSVLSFPFWVRSVSLQLLHVYRVGLQAIKTCYNQLFFLLTKKGIFSFQPIGFFSDFDSLIQSEQEYLNFYLCNRNTFGHSDMTIKMLLLLRYIGIRIDRHFLFLDRHS